jgi:hypothetical protein
MRACDEGDDRFVMLPLLPFEEPVERESVIIHCLEEGASVEDAVFFINQKSALGLSSDGILPFFHRERPNRKKNTYPASKQANVAVTSGRN